MGIYILTSASYKKDFSNSIVTNYLYLELYLNGSIAGLPLCSYPGNARLL